MRKAQYDDIYIEWYEGKAFIKFNNIEDEESYARVLRLHHR